jgi:hypothetical protein
MKAGTRRRTKAAGAKLRRVAERPQKGQLSRRIASRVQQTGLRPRYAAYLIFAL